MSPPDLHTLSAAQSIERGLPPIGYRLRPQDGVTLIAIDREVSGAIIRAEEREGFGRLVGEIELTLFGASFIIDRAGVLRDTARAAAAALMAAPARGRILAEGEVELGAGATGHRIDALLQRGEDGRFRPPRPYVSWLALASPDVVLGGGVLVALRSARSDWSAGNQLIDSIEIVGPGDSGSSAMGLGRGAPSLGLPLVGRR